MSISVSETKLDGVLLIQPEWFEDHRGEYVEIYNGKEYVRAGVWNCWPVDDYSRSRKNVLRGIHGDYKTWKLISCLYGEFYLVVVDCRPDITFGKWEGFVLSDRNKLQVLVPPGFGNAHLVLSDEAIFHYKQSEYYDCEGQFTYRWDDPRFNIWWPIDNPILSERDKKGDDDEHGRIAAQGQGATPHRAGHGGEVGARARDLLLLLHRDTGGSILREDLSPR